MFGRETHRARAGVSRRVHRLWESYVYRDIWTRLNVKPAKIMQVSYSMAWLKLKTIKSSKTLRQVSSGSKRMECGKAQTLCERRQG